MGRRQVRIGIRGRVVTIEVRQAIKVTIVSVATAERRPETRTYRLREYTRLKAVQRYKFHTIIKNLIIKKPPGGGDLFIAADDFRRKERTIFQRTCFASAGNAWTPCSTATAVCAGSLLSRRPHPLHGIYPRNRVEVTNAFAEGRRQARSGKRGREVTKEVRQAIKVTTVSAATAERRPETR